MTSTPLSHEILALSAESDAALTALAAAQRTALVSAPESWRSLCHAAVEAPARSERLAVLGASALDLADKLATAPHGHRDHEPRLGFLFTGQGSQSPAMARELFSVQADFRDALTTCDRLLAPHTGWSLLSVLYGEDAVDVNQTGYAQPLLFSIEYALATMWRTWGVQPHAVLGHSVGEYVAACLAGVFSLEDGLKLIAARGRFMQALPSGGGMLAVTAEEPLVREAIAPHAATVSVAAINGVRQIVIAGALSELQTIGEALKARGIASKPLTVSHAFHSPLMQPMLAEFARVAESVTYRTPSLTVISNVTGATATQDIASAAYWEAHVSAPVRFAQGVAHMRAQGCDTFLEIGPQAVLGPMGRRALSDNQVAWLTSLRAGQSDWSEVLSALGALFVRGVNVDWAAFYR